MFGKKRTQAVDDQETELAPDTEAPNDERPAIAPAEPLSAGQFDQQGETWTDGMNAATDHPAHPLRHLKGV